MVAMILANKMTMAMTNIFNPNGQFQHGKCAQLLSKVLVTDYVKDNGKRCEQVIQSKEKKNLTSKLLICTPLNITHTPPTIHL